MRVRLLFLCGLLLAGSSVLGQEVFEPVPFNDETFAGTSESFVTSAPSGSLTNEKVLTNTASVTWDFSTPGQAKATAVSSLSDGTVTNAKLADMAQNTIKGRVSSGAGVPEDLTAAQARTVLGIVVDQGTAGQTTTDDTTGVTTGIAFALSTGEYVLTYSLSVTTDATTTAAHFAINGSGGLVVGSLGLDAKTVTTAVASQSGSANALGSFTETTTGQGATERPVTIIARIRVTTAGTATLWMRSEVAGSAVTMVEGSGYAIKVA